MASQMASQMERQSRDQDRRMKHVESALERIEKTLNNINVSNIQPFFKVIYINTDM